MADLARPPSADELYRYVASAEDVVPLSRPVFQGDVFWVDDLPGVTSEPTLAVVMSHPCTMRGKGARLVPHLLMARVGELSTRIDQYEGGHYSKFPLPELVDGVGREVVLDELGRVSSDQLALDRRVAALSDNGLAVLQQRQIFVLTRHVVETEVLHAVNSPNLLEAELMEDWIEHALLRDVDIAAATERFDEFFAKHREPAKDITMHGRIRQDVRAAVHQEYP